MRPLPTAIAAALASGVANLCHCWRLTRRDGFTLGLTDHDRDLTIEGQLFEASEGFEASAIEREAGLATQGGEIRGLLTSERIKSAEVEAGLYDGARLEVFLVDWQAPALDFLLQGASLGEIRRIDNRFVAETRDAFAEYDVVRGRLYTSTCAARFGDPACGINAASHAVAAQVAAVVDAHRFRALAAGNLPTGALALGRARFPYAQGTIEVDIAGHEGDLVILSHPAPVSLAAGMSVTLTAGCDRRFVTCRDRFANALNFRGFPHIPAPESVFAYARPGEGRHQGRPLVR